jgi:aminomethyltransferase
VAKLATGRVGYTLWCNGAGHVLDDGTLFRLGAQSFQLCAQERHLEWLLDSAAGYDVTVADETEAIAALALQGPTSCAVLQAMGLDEIELLRPFASRGYDLDGHELLVSRTGFTGDLGYELWVRPEEAEELWDRLVQAGRHFGIRPVGTQALELTRIEAGFIMTNTDFTAAEQAQRHTRGRSPFELGLGRLVDFDKGHFNGRRALLEEQRKGSRYVLVGLDIEGNKPAAGALIYHRRKKEVGHITSAMWSPTCKANVALATLQAPYGDSITEDLWVEIYVLKELKWDKVMARCKVVPRPFFDPPRRRATPALDY